jgi:hypothetical protein
VPVLDGLTGQSLGPTGSDGLVVPSAPAMGSNPKSNRYLKAGHVERTTW